VDSQTTQIRDLAISRLNFTKNTLGEYEQLYRPDPQDWEGVEDILDKAAALFENSKYDMVVPMCQRVFSAALKAIQAPMLEKISGLQMTQDDIHVVRILGGAKTALIKDDFKTAHHRIKVALGRVAQIEEDLEREAERETERKRNRAVLTELGVQRKKRYLDNRAKRAQRNTKLSRELKSGNKETVR
jgi:hypothetical protein